MKTPLLTIIFALIALSTSLALTPQERELITGLKGIIADQKTEMSGLATDLAGQKAKTDEAQSKNETSMAALVKSMNTIADLQRDARLAAAAAAQLAAERDGLKDKVAEREATIAAQKADKAALLSSFHGFKLWTGSA